MANTPTGPGYYQGNYRQIVKMVSRANAYNLQLNAESHFHNDLGLDSLDTVEVVMAIEEVSRNPCGIWEANLTAVAGIQH